MAQDAAANLKPEDIKIIADPESNFTCRFTVDRPVEPERSFYFPNAEVAKGSPLAERLFALEGVAAVLIAHDRITVTVGQAIDWRTIGKEIGTNIREHVISGKSAIAAERWNELPSEDDIKKAVQKLLEEEINPSIASHGGFISLLDVKKNAIYLEMGGGCQGCGMAQVTLKQGVEKAIRKAAPEVGEILDATDHASGRNPYFRS